jgi:hypothetical protein
MITEKITAWCTVAAVIIALAGAIAGMLAYKWARRCQTEFSQGGPYCVQMTPVLYLQLIRERQIVK